MNYKKTTAGIFGAVTLLGGGVFGYDRAVNPYEDLTTHYELPIKADVEQGERVEISKERAEMTLKGWNDEYSIKVIPQIPSSATRFGATTTRADFTTQARRPLLSKRMEYKSGDVTAFIEPVDNTENEFEIDFTLDSKPDTNVFEYIIEGAEGFDFFYQPELTAEEIAEGVFRPENVIGSYAVYHKEKANHLLGTTKYATGKIMHIYRPKVIDANNNETWAVLNFEKGILSVTVPQKFLDTAVYPVVVDPVFGYTSIGGSSSPTSSGDRAVGFASIISEDGDVTSITYYIASYTGTTDVKAGLYDTVSGAPENLLGTSVEITGIDSTPEWNTFTFPTAVSLTSGNKYWISAIHKFGHIYYFDVDAPAERYFQSDTYSDGFQNPNTQTVSTGRNISIYATYTQPTVSGEYRQAGTFTTSSASGGSVDWTNPTRAQQSDNLDATAGSGLNSSLYDDKVRIIKADGSIGTTDKASTTAWATSDSEALYGGASDLWGETWTYTDINDADFGVAISADDTSTVTYYLKATNFGFDVPSGATINGIEASIEKARYTISPENYGFSIDHIKLRVYYTEGGGGGSSTQETIIWFD